MGIVICEVGKNTEKRLRDTFVNVLWGAFSKIDYDHQGILLLGVAENIVNSKILFAKESLQYWADEAMPMSIEVRSGRVEFVLNNRRYEMHVYDYEKLDIKDLAMTRLLQLCGTQKFNAVLRELGSNWFNIGNSVKNAFTINETEITQEGK